MEFVSYKKIVIFGSEGVGKTSLTTRLGKNIFEDQEVFSNSCNFKRI